MPFPVLGSNSAVAEFAIDNSLRFNEGDDAKLSFDPASAGNVDTMTLSFWMKPDLNFGGDHNNIFSVRPSAGSYAMLVHRTGGEILFEHSGAGDILKTNRLFRDPSAWYHIVLALDSTNSTAALRARLYVNGIEETSFATDNRASHSQNTDFLFGGTNPHQISGDPTGGSFYGGYLSEMYYVNGSQLAPTEFGEFNENGVWVPKRFSGSYGTNGFKLEFKDSGNLGDDTSGNGNDFTATNLTATDQTTDTPTNNFCTFNPLDNDTVAGAASFSEGNLVINANSNANSGCASTIAVSNGAWYIEGKCLSGTFEMGMFGYGDGFSFNLANHPPYGDNGYTFAYEYDGNLRVSNLDVQTGLATFTTNDILAIALDMDNNTIKFFKNNTQVGTTITDSNLSTFAPYTFYIANHTSGNSGNIFSLNTGNPAYTISSGNSDANGYGNFEYAVPSGYYALCTKNLAEYG
jgi:hypothetical protein